jgi:DNA-binding transcriptional LysR family regulator
VLRLAASHTIGEYVLPGWLAGFGDGAPLQFHVDVTNSTNVLAEVRRGDVDIGFVEGLDPLDGLEARVIEHDELVAVVAPGHRWAGGAEIDAGQLRDESYFARERDSGTRAVAAAAIAVHGVELRPSLETPSIQGLKRAVEGGGFTLMSTLSVQREVAAGLLCAVRVRGADLRRDLKAVRRAGETLPDPARRVWHQLPDLATRSGRASS